MTHEEHLETIRICLFEPLAELGGPMASMLRMEGFKHTEHVFTLDALRREIRANRADLLIIEADNHLADVARIIRDVRLGELGDNAFLVIMATLSDVTLESARILSFAGVDAILDKPYSPYAILTHLRDIAHRPRLFVVNGAYAGPEHRRSPRHDQKAVSIEVPNVSNDLLLGKHSDQKQEDDAEAEWARLVKKAKKIPKVWPDEPSDGTSER